MDLLLLSQIDEELDSSEAAELCFLCSDVVNRKRLEGITDAKGLFLRLEERGLLENSSFLSQLLHTIHRADLLNLLNSEGRGQEETDANPILSDYRVMLYRIHENMTNENLEKIKYLLKDDLGKRHMEKSSTALDVFTELEKMGVISRTNVNKLQEILLKCDKQLAVTVESYMDAVQHQQRPPGVPPARQCPQRPNNTHLPQMSCGEVGVFFDSPGASQCDEVEFYSLTREPRGSCVIFNNEHFQGMLTNRRGTEEDTKTLSSLFERFGFRIETYIDLSSDELKQRIKDIASRDFSNDDLLVVCILTHGEKGCVFGSDEKKVFLPDLTSPFTSDRAPTLAGKPKVFFIQACQNEGIQEDAQRPPESHSGLQQDGTLPAGADFLIGMSTVENNKSFRHTKTGSIYIQELCKQLTKSAESSEKDDLLTVLTRVNREVGKGVYARNKQMPEPRYTLTKKLAFRFV
ncbi:caspase-8 [Nematolebias whitei]|uniref:caspase-8 n=1 Tax=Nematolebias whitei TaxID=451745 RepID=UPI00189A1EB8|nr:caspase-8 [Nematolebias whitei]